MTHTEEMDFARKVATKLGADWHARRPEVQEGDRPDMYPPRLHGPDGMRLVMRFGGYQNEGRLRIAGDLAGDLHKHLSYNEREPSITVSESRTPDQIAREIMRRLLPTHIEQLARTTARKAEADQYEREREALKGELMRAAGINSTAHDGTLYLNAGGVYACISVSSDGIQIDRLSVKGRDACVRLVRLLGELSRESS